MHATVTTVTFKIQYGISPTKFKRSHGEGHYMPDWSHSLGGLTLGYSISGHGWARGMQLSESLKGQMHSKEDVRPMP